MVIKYLEIRPQLLSGHRRSEPGCGSWRRCCAPPHPTLRQIDLKVESQVTVTPRHYLSWPGPGIVVGNRWSHRQPACIPTINRPLDACPNSRELLRFSSWNAHRAPGLFQHPRMTRTCAETRGKPEVGEGYDDGQLRGLTRSDGICERQNPTAASGNAAKYNL